MSCLSSRLLPRWCDFLHDDAKKKVWQERRVAQAADCSGDDKDKNDKKDKKQKRAKPPKKPKVNVAIPAVAAGALAHQLAVGAQGAQGVAGSTAGTASQVLITGTNTSSSFRPVFATTYGSSPGNASQL